MLSFSLEQASLILNPIGILIYVLALLVVLRLFFNHPSRFSRLLPFFFLYSLLTCSFFFWSHIRQGARDPGMYLMSRCLLLVPAILFSWILFRFTTTVKRGKEVGTERFNQLKDEFLTVASHELRTPLSIISGFAEILLREKLGPLNDEQKRRVRKILMQGQRLNRIVDELLDLSRIRSGKVTVRKEIFAIVPVLKACYEDHVVVCDQQNIQFTEKIPDVLPDVKGDLDRVTQVIVNLLNNAIKYTPSGGKISLTACHDFKTDCVQIAVWDNGIGIDPHEQALIFDEFYRSQHPASRKHAGSGLGLAIVKQLVESQGGTVQVSSEGIDHGSTFSFSLPVSH